VHSTTNNKRPANLWRYATGCDFLVRCTYHADSCADDHELQESKTRRCMQRENSSATGNTDEVRGERDAM